MSKEFIIIYVLVLIIALLAVGIKNLTVRNQITKLKNNSLEMTPEEFFRMRNASNGGRGRRHISTNKDFPGVYILYNHDRGMYYVGQGKRVLQRVNMHFTGKGNGDVYADWKYGNRFTISMIALENSGFQTLNELERHAIQRYSAYSKGYNKTRGNRG